MTEDRHVIEMMEVLADIFACIFTETQEPGGTECSRRKQEVTSKGAQSGEA